ncbi:Alpha/Beta hydrolase protein [Penicillium viridicatum]|nr:Alpha/Beta hydrolase protein [Penicillium viridicatum]
MATVLQQTVFDIYAETKFDCPAQLLAEAFSKDFLQSWNYQFSVTPAYHGADMSTYISTSSSLPTDFVHAFQKVWGRFIINDIPVISVSDATGGRLNLMVPVAWNGPIDRSNFLPNYPWQMDLNATGSTITPVYVTPNLTLHELLGPDIVNDFRLANAYTWEGGRGRRCAEKGLENEPMPIYCVLRASPAREWEFSL